MFLLRHKLPTAVGSGFRWSLVGLKTEVAPYRGTTYIAFDTEHEANRFAATLAPCFQYSTVQHDRLDLDTFISDDSCMLVFETSDQLITSRERGSFAAARVVRLDVPSGIWGLVRLAKNWNAKRLGKRVAIEG